MLLCVGVWAKASGGTVYYNIDEQHQTFVRLNCGRDGRYYIPPKYDARLTRYARVIAQN